MTTQAHNHELESERDYLADLYDRLDAKRRWVKAQYRAALSGPIDIQDGGTLVARDAEVRTLAQSAARLDIADQGLCFFRATGRHCGRASLRRPNRHLRRGQRATPARLASAGRPRVLHRHRRQPPRACVGVASSTLSGGD